MLVVYHFLINLWCSFCPLLYIFYAAEIEPIIALLKKSVLGQLAGYIPVNFKDVGLLTMRAFIPLMLAGLTA